MSLRRPRFEDEEPAQTINISPLIDVIFILLIFFIVTMVFADGEAMNLDVPEASNSSDIKSDAVTVSIKSDSSLWVDGAQISMANLDAVLSSKLGRNKIVILRADQTVSVSELVGVMDSAKAAGAREIYVGTKKK